MPVTIRLSKSDSGVPWGFRLHGGKDFGAPLTVQRINPGSVAARCGLQIGDNIATIDSVPTSGLKHKEAQDLIVKAGNDMQLSIFRGDEIPVRPEVPEIFTPVQYEKATFKLTDSDNGLSGQVDNLSIGESYKPRIPSYSSMGAAYTAPTAPTISSKNASLYQPSLQNITSGLTKSSTATTDYNHDVDDFPPPPPILPPPVSPHQPLSPGNVARSHQPVHRFPDPVPAAAAAAVDNHHSALPKNSSETSRYVPSETYKLVKDIESGLEVPFNPRTGAGVKSSPIQSKLVDILEKKHATIEPTLDNNNSSSNYNSSSNNNNIKRSVSPQPPYSGPKSSNYGVQIGGAAYNRGAQPPQKFLGGKNPPSSTVPQHFGKPPSPQPLQPAQSKSSFIDKLDPSAVPICNVCNTPVRGAYVMAINKIWCPEHFVCGQPGCKRNLSDVGFVEEQGQVYCKDDYEKYFAPRCAKCNKGIVGNTVKALKSTYHPECFTCVQCNQAIMGGSFHLNQGQIYCDRDFTELFSAKCQGCNFPIEVGDNWIEAVGTNWHGECFNCSVCQMNLQNTGFVHKSGRFLCRDHAR